jgi:hypothetical protein
VHAWAGEIRGVIQGERRARFISVTLLIVLGLAGAPILLSRHAAQKDAIPRIQAKMEQVEVLLAKLPAVGAESSKADIQKGLREANELLLRGDTEHAEKMLNTMLVYLNALELSGDAPRRVRIKIMQVAATTQIVCLGRGRVADSKNDAAGRCASQWRASWSRRENARHPLWRVSGHPCYQLSRRSP